MNPGEEPGVVRGTLEFTSSTGLRYRRTPIRLTSVAADLDDPLIATAVAHAHLRAAQTAADEARMNADAAVHAGDVPARRADLGIDSESDAEDLAWRRSQADLTRRRIRDGAASATRTLGLIAEPPF